MENRERVVRWGWLLPLVGLLFILGGTFFLDRQTHEQLESRRRAAASEAESEASALAEDLAAEMAGRIGALAAAKLQFTQLEDSLSRRTFVSAVDSVIGRLPGMVAVSLLYPDGRLLSSRAAGLDGEVDPLASPALADAYARALVSRRPSATPVIDLGGDRRLVILEAVAPSDTAPIQAVLAAELEPLPILRSALEQERPRQRPAFYSLFDADGTRITTVPAPEGWPSVRRSVRVADTEWDLFVAHQPLNERTFTATIVAIRLAGVLLAVAFGLMLFALWRMVVAQEGEIQLRQAAESRARERSEQLRSAQEAALRLSGAMDPDRVVDEFLGAVGVEIGADVGRLYDFEDGGDVLVGRRLLILDRALAETGELSEESFREVRLPAAMMPHLAEPVATGEPHIGKAEQHGAILPEGNGAAPLATFTVPLAIGGHLVGLAVWESHRSGDAFDGRAIPFVQAVSAHAAAALRAAELLDGVRQARQRAAKEAVRLATVLDQMTDGVVLFDRDGMPERVNAAAEELLGPDLAVTRLSAWPTAFRIREHTDGSGFPPTQALAGHTVADLRFTVRRKGLERYLAASAAPIRSTEGPVRGAAMVVRDVTAEHEYAEMLRFTNQELRQQATLLERTNDDLRAATAAKDQFLAMMSHELRTPINAIIGYSDILALGIHGKLGGQQEWMLSRVTDTSRHLLGLIEDVLDLTKIGAGRIRLDVTEVSLDPILGRAESQVLPLAAEKGITLRREGERGLQILADETRLLQVLINLCSNAVKFTEEGEIVMSARRSDYHALIAVRDTGAGIPKDHIEDVFEEFHQVDAGLARKTGGSGLGLTISRRLARLMGGDITVESTLGVGTTFVVHIPLAGRRIIDRVRADAAS